MAPEAHLWGSATVTQWVSGFLNLPSSRSGAMPTHPVFFSCGARGTGSVKLGLFWFVRCRFHRSLGPSPQSDRHPAEADCQQGKHDGPHVCTATAGTKMPQEVGHDQ